MTARGRHAFRRLLIVVLAAGTAGCAALQLPDPQRTPESDLVEFAASLTRLDGEQRRAALDDALSRWEDSGSPRDRARVGLARGQWGHTGHDPLTAAEDIEAALAAESAVWRQAERPFLELRAAQLAYLAAREDEHRRTQHELDEARRKLRAITDIERSLGRGTDEE